MAHKVRIRNISDDDSEGVVVRTWKYTDEGSEDQNIALARNGYVEIDLADIDNLSIDDVVLQTQNPGTRATFREKT